MALMHCQTFAFTHVPLVHGSEVRHHGYSYVYDPFVSPRRLDTFGRSPHFLVTFPHILLDIPHFLFAGLQLPLHVPHPGSVHFPRSIGAYTFFAVLVHWVTCGSSWLHSSSSHGSGHHGCIYTPALLHARLSFVYKGSFMHVPSVHSGTGPHHRQVSRTPFFPFWARGARFSPPASFSGLVCTGISLPATLIHMDPTHHVSSPLHTISHTWTIHIPHTPSDIIQTRLSHAAFTHDLFTPRLSALVSHLTSTLVRSYHCIRLHAALTMPYYLPTLDTSSGRFLLLQFFFVPRDFMRFSGFGFLFTAFYVFFVRLAGYCLTPYSSAWFPRLDAWFVAIFTFTNTPGTSFTTGTPLPPDGSASSLSGLPHQPLFTLPVSLRSVARLVWFTRLRVPLDFWDVCMLSFFAASPFLCISLFSACVLCIHGPLHAAVLASWTGLRRTTGTLLPCTFTRFSSWTFRWTRTC